MNSETAAYCSMDYHRRVLDQVPTPVMAVDADLRITYMNPIGLEWLGLESEQITERKCADILKTPHCGTDDCRTCLAMQTGNVEHGITEICCGSNTFPVEYTSQSLLDDDGSVIGAVEYIVDITERELARQTIEEQHEAILDLSTPVVELSAGVLLVPLIGVIDTMRSEQMTERLLESIVAQEACVAVLDVTGVPVIDTSVAQHLLRAVSAAKMLGTEIILTGFSPQIAQTLVQLNIEFSALRTRGSLRAGVQEALRLAKSSQH